jgi:hypothetical protein
MINVIYQDTDLWEVWIEYDQFHPHYFGTLYVHGEILTDQKQCSLVKVDSNNCSQLILQLPEKTSDHFYAAEVLYSEPVKNLNQYSSVFIYKGTELIGCLTDIEIMI